MNEEKKTSILIVEDDAIINKTYSEELRAEGFVVYSAENGRDGLEIALRDNPDIILLDIMMPIMDGLTMMGKLRETNSYGKAVPIILLTSLSQDEEKVIQAVKKNEPEYYLVKTDWDIKKVVIKIKERLMPIFGLTKG